MAIEADNPLGEYEPDLFPRLSRAADFLARVLSPIKEAPLFMSEHYEASHFNTGAAPMLDMALDIPDGVILGED